jgi:hypothetical protein
MDARSAELDPDAPIPYVLTPLGKAECIVSRMSEWRDEPYRRHQLKLFRTVCEETFTPEETEALFSS